MVQIINQLSEKRCDVIDIGESYNIYIIIHLFFLIIIDQIQSMLGPFTVTDFLCVCLSV